MELNNEEQAADDYLKFLDDHVESQDDNLSVQMELNNDEPIEDHQDRADAEHAADHYQNLLDDNVESFEHQQNRTDDHDAIDTLENANITAWAAGYMEVQNQIPAFEEAEQLVQDDGWQNVKIGKMKSFVNNAKDVAPKTPARYLLHNFYPQIVRPRRS